MASKRKITDLQIRRALIRNKGNLTAAAKECDVTYGTIRRRMNQNPRIQEAFDHHQEELVDLAMENLKDELRGGNWKATQYTLNNIGESRGFGAKKKQVEKEENNQSNLIVNILDTEGLDSDMKKKMLEALQKQKKLLEEGGQQ
jgi:hypothetical protein